MRDVLEIMNRQFGKAMMDSLGVRVEDTFSVGLDLEKAWPIPAASMIWCCVKAMSSVYPR